VHRDIKPENIVTRLDDPNTLVLIDFGISQRLCLQQQKKKPSQQHLIGTLAWASLNAHAQARPLGPSDDLESLAYVFLCLVHGGLPWDRPNGEGYVPIKVRIARVARLKACFPSEDDRTASEVGVGAETIRLLDVAREGRVPNYPALLESWSLLLPSGTASGVLDWTSVEPLLPLAALEFDLNDPKNIPLPNSETLAIGRDDDDEYYSDSYFAFDYELWEFRFARSQSLTFPAAEAAALDESIPVIPSICDPYYVPG
jgi:serine/threonine protein kinase